MIGNNKKNNSFKAFTLVEMVVATAIFSLVITVYMGIFLSTFKANGRVLAQQKVQNEIRYILDLVSKELRLGTINYSYYDLIKNPEQVLAIKDISDNTIYFDGDNGNFRIKYGEDGIWNELNTNNIYVEDLKFYIYPTKDPFSQVNDSVKYQPLVTLYMHVKYEDEDEMAGNMKIQTSISSRQYKR